MIKHNPIYSMEIPASDVQAVEPTANYNYVCSTELTPGGQVMDIWHTDTPFMSTRLNQQVTKYCAVLTNDAGIPWPYIPADSEIESLTFVMAPDLNGDLHYSRGASDLIHIHDDSKIDGGRFAPVHEGDVITYKIVDGEFVPVV